MQSTEMRIWEAALNLFAQKGYEATSIRDIAEKAGITSSALYYYIGTKEDFLIKIMQEGLTDILEGARYLVSIVSLPECQLASLVQLHVIVHGVNQLVTLVTDVEFRSLKGENRTAISKLRKEYELIWRYTLDRGRREGVFHFQDLKLTAFALLEMCTGVAHWYSSQGPIKIKDIASIYADMALSMVNATRNGKKLSVKDLDLPCLKISKTTVTVMDASKE